MRRTIVLLAAALGALCIPSAAFGQAASGSDCGYATGNSGSIAAAYAEATPNGSGTSGTADAAVGACLNYGPGIGGVQGGSAEVGVGNNNVGPGGPEGAYAVIDGDNNNNDILSTGQSDGYIGLSNYETGTAKDNNCNNGPDQGQVGTSNSGGCAGVDNVAWAPIPLIVCGNSSGNTWHATSPSGRDGCSIP